MSNSTSPSSVTVPTLAELAQQIRTSHAAVQAAGATVLHHVFSAGGQSKRLAVSHLRTS